MYVHRRANWEFLAVLKGHCAPVLPGQKQPTFETRRLWVYPPESPHGWTGQRSTPCEVAIFHFSTVPPLLQRTVHARGPLSVALGSGPARRITRLVAELKPHYERMTETSGLVFERALLDLTLMAMGNVPTIHAETKTDFALRKVEGATIWYEEHMLERPKLEEVARAIHLSPRHLRRLFHTVHGIPPQVWFTRLRLNRAMKLMAETDLKLETIAARCGFASGTDFHRVFKQNRRTSPDTWRRNQLYAHSKRDDSRMLRS